MILFLAAWFLFFFAAVCYWGSNFVVSASVEDLDTLARYAKELNSPVFDNAITAALRDDGVKRGEFIDLKSLYKEIKMQQAEEGLLRIVKNNEK
nr:hypothetical protein [Plesiomonas shigelloides]